jgi:hypothetical protein
MSRRLWARNCVSHGDKAVADGVDVACNRSALEGFRADFKRVYCTCRRRHLLLQLRAHAGADRAAELGQGVCAVITARYKIEKHDGWSVELT